MPKQAKDLERAHSTSLRILLKITGRTAESSLKVVYKKLINSLEACLNLTITSLKAREEAFLLLLLLVLLILMPLHLPFGI